jgi:pSer/pThr/pTyr-binding forkhead associated (FHA) protein
VPGGWLTADGRVPEAVLVDSRSGDRYRVVLPKCKLGRDPSNHVVTSGDPYASRYHAWIVFEEGHYFVEDLGSTNGTLLNGSPLTRRRPIVNGDHLRVGRTDFTFVSDVARVPLSSGSTSGAHEE